MSTFESLVQLVRHSSRAIVRELGLLHDDVDEFSLSYRHLLIELGKKGPLTSTDMSVILKLDKSTISRMVNKLIKKKLITLIPNPSDQRLKNILLTESGKKIVSQINHVADKQVKDALCFLSEKERSLVEKGLVLYAHALKQSRLDQDYYIRPIKQSDNVSICQLIQDCLKEFGADREGFAFADPDLGKLYQSHNQPGWFYLVVVRKTDHVIVGGGGVGTLQGASKSLCELKKMYLSSEVRGTGLGNRLLQMIIEQAKSMGYKKCYLETLRNMNQAVTLYKRSGFIELDRPLGDSGHFGCDAWYIKKL